MELRLDERLDHGVLDVLGPQLIRGKKIKLAQAMKAAPEGWAVKYVLMNQLVYERERRFAVPESEYARFYAGRSPGSVMWLWAGCMEPPGKLGGPVLGFADFSLNETGDSPSETRSSASPGGSDLRSFTRTGTAGPPSTSES